MTQCQYDSTLEMEAPLTCNPGSPRETQSEYNPNLSNQYLYKPNVALPDISDKLGRDDDDDEAVTEELDLPHQFEGLGERIEGCMEMTMEAFPCFDFQYPSNALSRRGELLGTDPFATLWGKQNMHGNKAGLYLHIPYCRSKCSFCYFTVAANRGEDEVDRYLDTLEKEIKMVAPYTRDREIESIYIGGGTPTWLTARQLDRLFKMVHDNFDLSAFSEWTIESTPNLATLDKLRVMKEHGITRFSMGVQSTHDHLLKRLNRSFERKDIENVIDMARAVGLTNINLDLMYALPGQTAEDWLNSLQDVFAKDIPGITIYSLDLHETTQFFRIRDQLQMPDLKTQLYMYDAAADQLRSHGYQKINTSIWGREQSCYTQQNRRWENLPLIAFGPGAQSYAPGYAFRNVGDLKRYMELIDGGKPALDRYTTLAPGQEYYREAVSMIRFAMLDKAGFKSRHGASVKDSFSYLIKVLIDLGYIEETEHSVHLTPRGLRRSNMLSMFFYSDLVKRKLVDHFYTAHAPQMRALRSVGLTENANLV